MSQKDHYGLMYLPAPVDVTVVPSLSIIIASVLGIALIISTAFSDPSITQSVHRQSQSKEFSDMTVTDNTSVSTGYPVTVLSI
jgi:hypothetical protein